MSEHETIADIIAWLRKPREGENAYLTLWRDEIADRLEAAYKREVDVLKQRCVELDAEVAAKDEVIKRLNDAIAEEQRRKMTTTEKFLVVDTKFELCHYPEQVLKIGRGFQNKDGFRGAHYDTVKLLCDTIEYQQEQLKTKTEVGDCAKLREALEALMIDFDSNFADDDDIASWCNVNVEIVRKARAALAAPPRNCDKYVNHNDAMKAFEAFVRKQDKLGFINPYTEAFKWLFAPATEKEGGNDGNE